jgi:hypothetical protein
VFDIYSAGISCFSGFEGLLLSFQNSIGAYPEQDLLVNKELTLIV